MVYDIANRKTFEEIKTYFIYQIEEKCQKDIIIILLGNKTDLENLRQVSIEEGANYASDKGFMFLETSCLINRNVANSFETLIELTYREAIKKYQIDMTEKGLIINQSVNKKEDKGKCPC